MLDALQWTLAVTGVAVFFAGYGFGWVAGRRSKR